VRHLPERWNPRPWRTIRELRGASERQREQITSLLAASRKLKDDNRLLKDQVQRLLKPEVPEGVTDLGLDFVIVGFERGNGLG
jgi:hypothetical protein